MGKFFVLGRYRPREALTWVDGGGPLHPSHVGDRAPCLVVIKYKLLIIKTDVHFLFRRHCYNVVSTFPWLPNKDVRVELVDNQDVPELDGDVAGMGEQGDAVLCAAHHSQLARIRRPRSMICVCNCCVRLLTESKADGRYLGAFI